MRYDSFVYVKGRLLQRDMSTTPAEGDFSLQKGFSLCRRSRLCADTFFDVFCREICLYFCRETTSAEKLLLQRDYFCRETCLRHLPQRNMSAHRRPQIQRNNPFCRETNPSSQRHSLLQRDNPFCREKTPSAERDICDTFHGETCLHRDDSNYRRTTSFKKRQTLLQRENPFCRETYVTRLLL